MSNNSLTVERRRIKMANVNTSSIKVSGISQEQLMQLLANAGITDAQVTAAIRKPKVVDYLTYTDETKTMAVCKANPNHVFNVMELDEETHTAVMKSGLCPDCLAIMKQAAEIKAASGFRTRAATDNRPSADKPGFQIREIVKNNLSNLDDETLAKLQDKQFSKEHFKLAYAMLLDITGMSNDEIKVARMVGKHARYAPAVYTVGDKQFMLTNDLYAKNLQPIKEFFEAFNN